MQHLGEDAVDERHQARELAMQAVFARDVGLGRPRDVLAHFCQEAGVADAVRSMAEELVEGVVAHLPELDRRIVAYARGWSLMRIGAVERSILRLAVYELCHRADIPAAVVIAEAIHLADTFSGEEAGRFVNGILGQFARDMAKGTPKD